MAYTSEKKEEQLMLDCYRELFAKSNPKGDFDKLMAEATINKRGEKEIPFDDYEIDDGLLREIIDKYAKQVHPKWKRLRFRNTIFLGCSPRSINVS